MNRLSSAHPSSRRGALLAAILLLTLLAPASAIAAPCAGSEIQGTIFHDYNADGANSAGNVELGVAGAVITVFSADGSSASCESLADGTYAVDAPAGGFPVRVEVTLPTGAPWDFLEPGAAGLTSTFFVDAAASGLDVGFNAPLDYCQANPDVLASCFLRGDPLFPGSDSAIGDVVVSVDYNRTALSPVTLALGAEAGAGGLAARRDGIHGPT